MNVFQIVLIVLLVLVFGGFVGVMFFEGIAQFIGALLGLSEKNSSLRFLGLSMGGILIALQALMSYKRAKAMEDAAKAQAKATSEQAKANLHTEEGLRQERLKNAIEHFEHVSDTVRLGGAYELFNLAQENEDFQKPVFDILCAHIRRTTGEKTYQKLHESKPSPEIQSLLTLLFVEQHDAFKGLRPNLRGSFLNGANLISARLGNASLIGAFLQRVFLYRAFLQGANFMNANLIEAGLSSALMRGTVLIETSLQGANFVDTCLQGAILENTNLQGAQLKGTRLQGVTTVNFEKAKLGFTFEFPNHIRESIGKKSDLSGIVLGSGIEPGRDRIFRQTKRCNYRVLHAG